MNEVPQNERNRVIRYICYRSAALALLFHEREEIPGLLTAAIRMLYPDENVVYTGFIPPRDYREYGEMVTCDRCETSFSYKARAYHLHVAACMGSLNV